MINRKQPETVAWLVLCLAFVSCIALTIGLPASTRWYILNATRPLRVELQPRTGIVTFQARGQGDPVLINDSREAFPNSRITLSSNNAEALLLFYLPEGSETPVSTLQLYGQTDVTFTAAKTPRFTASKLPHQISLQVNAGKELRVSVGGDGRTSALRLQTPHGALELEEGSYTLAVDSERTEITVSKGRARLPGAGNTYVLLTDFQRAILSAEGLSEVLPGERRDIVRNSDFDQEIGAYWQVFTRRKQYGDQSDGAVTWKGGERTIIYIERQGIGHIETGINQELNQNIAGAKSLQITSLLRVNQQSLPFCGQDATECPIMIRITYLDTQGGLHEWLQGFYYLVGGGYSAVCTGCEGSPRHIQVPQGAWYPYTSPDLIPQLQERGIEPATILSVDVYASGHSFIAEVDQVAILIEQ